MHFSSFPLLSTAKLLRMSRMEHTCALACGWNMHVLWPAGWNTCLLWPAGGTRVCSGPPDTQRSDSNPSAPTNAMETPPPSPCQVGSRDPTHTPNSKEQPSSVSHRTWGTAAAPLPPEQHREIQHPSGTQMSSFSRESLATPRTRKVSELAKKTIDASPEVPLVLELCNTVLKPPRGHTLMSSRNTRGKQR